MLFLYQQKREIKMKIKIVVAVAIVISVLIACGATEPEWKEYISSDGEFTIEAPGDPEIEDSPIETPLGTLTIRMYIWDLGDIAYLAAYVDYPQEIFDYQTPEELLDFAADGAVEGISGILISKTPITYEQHPGLELKINAPADDATAIARIYLVENRLYQVLVVTYIGEEKPEKTARFLDSFTITH
jgi:hypothetical protein